MMFIAQENFSSRKPVYIPLHLYTSMGGSNMAPQHMLMMRATHHSVAIATRCWSSFARVTRAQATWVSHPGV